MFFLQRVICKTIPIDIETNMRNNIIEQMKHTKIIDKF